MKNKTELPKELENALQKLLNGAEEQEKKRKELMLANAHPLVSLALSADNEACSIIVEEIERQAQKALERMIFLSVHSSWAINLLKAIHERVIETFGDKHEAEEFALCYMNQTKEKLVEIFTEPFVVAKNTTYDFHEARNYIETLETYQTSSLIVDFATKLGDILCDFDDKRAEKENGRLERHVSTVKKFQSVQTKKQKKRNKELIGLLQKYQLKQYELAKILGVHQPLISQWVTGLKEMLMSISEIEDAIKLKIGERND